MTTIHTNLHLVRQRIHTACMDSGRDPYSVTLLAVTKTQPPQALREAYAAGLNAFGENYIQEALDKITVLRDLPVQWHCIGPIQSNKTRPVAEQFDWVHSLDRLKIAQRLSEQRPTHLPPLQVCIQVNIDGGNTKAGVAPQDALALAQAITTLPRLRLRGLMTIPEPTANKIATLAIHSRAKALFDTLKQSLNTAGEAFDTLSIGMSADLEPAITAGSTMVRVGTAIFGARAGKAMAVAST